jgi:hypothetical protein
MSAQDIRVMTSQHSIKHTTTLKITVNNIELFYFLVQSHCPSE